MKGVVHLWFQALPVQVGCGGHRGRLGVSDNRACWPKRPAPGTVVAMGCDGLGRLVAAWDDDDGRFRPHWAVWRVVIAQLVADPARLRSALSRRPELSGHPVVDALVASVAEKLADDAGLPRPPWCAQVPPPPRPYHPPVGPLRGVLVPPQLALRGLWVPLEALWPEPESAPDDELLAMP